MSGDEPSNLWSGVPAPPVSDEPKPSDGPSSPPVFRREIFAVVAAIILADTTIYHGAGFTGIAVLLVGLTALFWFGVSRPRCSMAMLGLAASILLVSLKLVWCGFAWTVAAGVVAVLAFGLLQTTNRLRLLELCDYPFRAIFSGGVRLNDYGRFLSKGRLPSVLASLAVVLPLGALFVFGTIFVLANPDLVAMIRQRFLDFGDFLSRFTNWLPDFLQVPFWIFCAWLVAGLLSPPRLFDVREERPSEPLLPSPPEEQSPYYAACRNMLVAVIVLFAAYLVFEFETLWFRTFPEGFCYSGYSHEGAAWLTVALAVSTVTLSSVFRGGMLHDPRIGTLRTLAWIWSTLNIVLVVAVFNRLSIYIGFNGMTRMRVVGLLGMTAVLVGFVLVVRKIAEGRNFSWLLPRFAWTVLLMLFIDCVLPVDWLVHRYNVSRILHGDLAPSVQISVHPCADEGFLTFLPLVHCDDEIIREGIRAHLANKLRDLRRRKLDPPPVAGPSIVTKKSYAWTRLQLADRCLERQLETNEELFADYLIHPDKADVAFKRFAEYAYRWY